MPELLHADDLATALHDAYPELDAVRAAAVPGEVFLVGGAVRDLLLGRGRADLDLVVVGDAAALAARLGGEPVEHERFATAKVRLDGHEIDVASARTESYAHPGALPEVEPAGEIEADLRRRDFTINAMAVPLPAEPGLIDPHGGREDLGAGLLRVLHRRSLEDDPTRAIRAARYAARFGFRPETETEALIRAATLDTVSADRRRAELLRLAAEPSAAEALGLLGAWGLLDIPEEALALAGCAGELLGSAPWRDFAPRAETVLAAVSDRRGGERALAAATPERPSQAVELARGHGPVDLALARALGAEWLDRYLLEWRYAKLEIDGEDLLDAGVAQGPAVGRGLDAALRAKLDGEISGRERELKTALAAAREAGGR